MSNNFWQDKKVFITGHHGFLGSHLTKTLIMYGAKVCGIDKAKARAASVSNSVRGRVTNVKGNIVNLKLLKCIIDRYKPQIIFHLAAEPIVGEAVVNPVKVFKSNIQGSWNILEACRGKAFIKAVIVASSDKAYGSCNHLPYEEDYPLKGQHPYDVSKSCADLLSYAYFCSYKLPLCVIRCGNIYGGGDFYFSRIAPEIMRSIIKDKTLLIRSNGKFIRDYIYIEDVVKGFMRLAEKMYEGNIFGEAFNLSCEKPVSVLELVEKAYGLAGKKPRYKILNKASHEIKYQYLSCKKAKKILNWKPKYSLEEGLKRTIAWYRDYFNKG